MFQTTNQFFTWGGPLWCSPPLSVNSSVTPLAAGLILLPTAGDHAGQICRAAGIQDALGQGKPGGRAHQARPRCPTFGIFFGGYSKM